METIYGKHSRQIDAAGLVHRAAGYETVLVDLGTGDGRFVLHAARSEPALLAIGLDAARENLREASRNAPANALFIIANALNLPAELADLAGRLAVNFPWGSLLEALLSGEPALMEGLWAVARPGALVEVRLNASALAEAGFTLEDGGWQAHAALERSGFRTRPPRLLDAAALRTLPTTWARRMAFGRRPEAVYLRAERAREMVTAKTESLATRAGESTYI